MMSNLTKSTRPRLVSETHPRMKLGTSAAPPLLAPLSKNCSHHFAVHIGEAEVASLETVGELGVFEAEEMQDRRVQIVNMHLVLDGMEAELIGLAVNHARLDAAAGHPDGVAVRMMVAPDLIGLE